MKQLIIASIVVFICLFVIPDVAYHNGLKDSQVVINNTKAQRDTLQQQFIIMHSQFDTVTAYCRELIITANQFKHERDSVIKLIRK